MPKGGSKAGAQEKRPSLGPSPEGWFTVSVLTISRI